MDRFRYSIRLTFDDCRLSFSNMGLTPVSGSSWARTSTLRSNERRIGAKGFLVFPLAFIPAGGLRTGYPLLLTPCHSFLGERWLAGSHHLDDSRWCVCGAPSQTTHRTLPGAAEQGYLMCGRHPHYLWRHVFNYITLWSYDS